MRNDARRRGQVGFTLIELIAVIAIIAIAAVPLFSLFSQAGLSVLGDEKRQTATQLAQERAEYLMGVRRNRGYADPDVSTPLVVENLSGNYAGYTRMTTVTEPFLGPACPRGAACKQLGVRVDESGDAHAEVTLILVDY